MTAPPRPSRPLAMITRRARTSPALVVEADEPVGLRGDQPDLDAVLDRQVEDAAVPAQVVHPHRPRDAEELLPGRGAELRPEPGLEAERGDAQGRAEELLRRAQRLHAGIGHPRPLEALGAAVEDAEVRHAAATEREGGDEAAHAAADDDDVADRAAVGAAGLRDPGGRRVVEKAEVAAEDGLEGVEAGAVDFGRAVDGHGAAPPSCAARWRSRPASRPRPRPRRGRRSRRNGPAPRGCGRRRGRSRARCACP